MGKDIKKAMELIGSSLRTVGYWLMHKPLAIEYLVFEVTNACNSRCRHCNIWQNKNSPVMSAADIEKIFKTGFFKNVKGLILTGGEPVLRPDILEVMLMMQKHISPEAEVSLSTNGLLPEKVAYVAKQCLEHGMNLVVGVSLDGIGTHHDEIRGVPGNFEKVDSLLKKLIGLKEKYNRLQIIIGYTLSRYTVPYLEEVREYASVLGLDFLPQVFEVFPYYANAKLNEVVWNKDMERVVCSCSDGFQKEIMLSCARGERLNYRCASLKSFFVLRANGDVVPCLKHSDLKAGNLKEDNINNIFSSDLAGRAKSVVRECPGCSNTWATTWSMRYWVFPFLGKLINAFVKKRLRKK